MPQPLTTTIGFCDRVEPVDLPFAGLGVAEELAQFLVQGNVSAGPIDAGMHPGEAESQERFKIPVQRLLPETVVIHARSSRCRAHDVGTLSSLRKERRPGRRVMSRVPWERAGMPAGVVEAWQSVPEVDGKRRCTQHSNTWRLSNALPIWRE
jgi:hypothetical protein